VPCGQGYSRRVRLRTVLVVVVVVLAGCGKDEPTPQDDVRSTLEGFATAVLERDYQALCDRYFSPSLITGLERSGLPCEAALRPELSATNEPHMTIGDITVNGTTAEAQVHTEAANQPPSDDVVSLKLEEGAWRVAALADVSPQPVLP
jgi:hypothetical protein